VPMHDRVPRPPGRWSSWLLPPLDFSGRPAPQRDDSFRQEQSRNVDDHDDRFASANGERRAIARATERKFVAAGC
jgi:hypothetical protein